MALLPDESMKDVSCVRMIEEPVSSTAVDRSESLNTLSASPT